jgi:uncharacterized protein (TIGR03435 family)
MHFYVSFLKRLAICAFGAALLQGQSDGPSAFEVASIRESATRDGSISEDFPAGGRFTARNITLHYLLRIAYELQDYQISGEPGWATSAGFDIQAAPPAGTGNLPIKQVRLMVRALLTERFHLETHLETRQLPVFDLVVAKNGPRLQPAAADAVQSRSLRRGQLVAQKMDMAALANVLALDLKRPVNDRTGLKGDYAFTLDWALGLAETEDGAPTRPSLFTAVGEQLGLKLEATKGPVSVLVVERAEKPSEN